ncbi:MAG: hypothetical protein ACP5OG_02110 [Candidatus Nanoarchaeia archaeon]
MKKLFFHYGLIFIFILIIFLFSIMFSKNKGSNSSEVVLNNSKTLEFLNYSPLAVILVDTSTNDNPWDMPEKARYISNESMSEIVQCLAYPDEYKIQDIKSSEALLVCFKEGDYLVNLQFDETNQTVLFTRGSSKKLYTILTKQKQEPWSPMLPVMIQSEDPNSSEARRRTLEEMRNEIREMERRQRNKPRAN